MPAAVSYGDGYEFMVLKTWQLVAAAVNISWHYSDEPSETHTLHRNL